MDFPPGYQGKRVLVTGGSSGVGAALVEILHSLKADVTVVDRNRSSLPGVAFVEADLSNEPAVREVADELAGIDVFFGNAGVAATQPTPTVMAVNYLANRHLTEAVLCQGAPDATVVLTASMAGGRWSERISAINELLDLDDWDEALAWIDAHPDVLSDPYAFSKECMQVFTMRSAREAANKGMRVNSVCPAPIDTPLLADFRSTMSESLIDWTIKECGGRIASPADVANVLAFLGSDAAAYVNGVNLLVDGGFTAAMTTGQIDLSGLS